MSRECLQSEVVWKFIIFICIFPIIYRGIYIYMLYIFFFENIKGDFNVCKSEEERLDVIS